MAAPGRTADAAAKRPFGFRPTRLRFSAQDSFFEDGDVLRHLSLRDVAPSCSRPPDAAAPPPPGPAKFCCQAAGCGAQPFRSLESYEHHYNVLHRNVCSACKRPFPSAHLLDIHLLEWHDSLFGVMAERGNVYQCLVESCPEKFKSSKDRKEHLIKIHQYPVDFRFDKAMKPKSTKATRTLSQEGPVPMDAKDADNWSQVAPVDGMEFSENTAENFFQHGAENPLLSRTSICKQTVALRTLSEWKRFLLDYRNYSFLEHLWNVSCAALA